jgi:hypothetical protein
LLDDACVIATGLPFPVWLQENVFAIIACIQLKMPLIIVGPPGSSKTLSFQIVQHAVLNDATVREGMVRPAEFVWRTSCC